MANEDRLKNFSEDYDSQGMTVAVSSNELPHNKQDEKELDDRNKIYSKILKNYSEYLDYTLEENKKNKRIVRNWMIGFFFTVVIMCILFIIVKSPLSIFSALVSLVSAIIVIPTKIVEYLFNPKETQQISEIIKNIQKYDKAIREDLSKEKNFKN